MSNLFFNQDLSDAIKIADTQRQVTERLREVLWAVLRKSGGEIRLTLKDQESMFMQGWKIITEFDPITGDLIIKAKVEP